MTEGAGDILELTLELKISGKTHKIVGGNIKRFALDLRSWGFSGELDFWISGEVDKDELFAAFIKRDLIEVTLTLEGVYNLPKSPPKPIKLQGLVREREVLEQVFTNVRGAPVLYRRYTIAFADPAAVLWTQHFPTLLVAEQTMESVIKDQKPDQITLDTGWAQLKVKEPMICLGLGQAEASFYDFLLWYVDRYNGQLYYDHVAHKYYFAEKKPTLSTTHKLRKTEVRRLSVALPTPHRHKTRILNSYTESAKSVTVEQKDATLPIYRDVLLRTPISKDIDDRKSLETKRLAQREPEMVLEFNQLPTIDFVPGSGIELQKEYFGAKLHQATTKYRVTELRLEGEAKKPDPADDHNEPHTSYAMRITARCEDSTDPVCRLPSLRRPSYPIYVEGKVHVEEGKKGDRTYSVFQDSETGLSHYKVDVPLWTQLITAPFDPHFMPGHTFVPAYRDSRVLLALYLYRAEIVRYLDWGSGVALTVESQGNHLLFGKNKESETSFQHRYVDNKPQLLVARVNSDDNETVTISEGSIVIETKREK